MKKMRLKTTTMVAMLLFSICTAYAQAPESMSYQAIIRNASSALVINTVVGMKISILQGSTTGTAIYVETQNPTTNKNGLVSIEIGKGTAVTGTVAAIDWSAGPYYIKTETDPAGGTTYSITGTTQLLSVPYALYAKTAGGGLKGDKGDTGPAGKDGVDGHDAAGMSVNCMQCHDHNPGTATGNAKTIANKKKEFEFSKHSELELAVEEGGSSGCAPCHSHEGFTDVVKNNVIPTYTLASGKYSFSYNASAAATSGLGAMSSNISCFTCHKGAAADSMALSTVAAVPMTMYAMPGKTKTIDLTQKGGESNLCVKCHQPRPMNNGTSTSVVLADGGLTAKMNLTKMNGASVDYADLAANPSNIFFNNSSDTAVFKNNTLIPGYRTHNHYGSVGAVFAGKGAVEFAGTLPYTDIADHTTKASCQDCHMAAPSGTAGGHSFNVSTMNETTLANTYNFNGCNVTGCHSASKITSTAAKWTTRRSTTLALLNTLASKLKSGSVEIMHKNTDVTSNIFAQVTTAGYDGYLDIYDPSTNPTGAIQNPVVASSWSAANKTTNAALPKLTSLTNLQMGAIINFQMFVREFSLGIHNPTYTDAVLNNTIDALTVAGF